MPLTGKGSNPTGSLHVKLLLSARAKYKKVEPYYMQDSNPLGPIFLGFKYWFTHSCMFLVPY
jgi:hypothetical protein